MTATAVIHFQTGSSTVRCGFPMRDRQHPEGWDLGTVSVEVREVTCQECMLPYANHYRTRQEVLAMGRVTRPPIDYLGAFARVMER
jgi:hypothetical protein